MPYQGHLHVGIPINSIADFQKAGAHFGITPPGPGGGHYEWADAFAGAGATITIEGKARGVSICSDDEAGFNYLSKNTKTGAIGNSYMLVGAALTSRYYPAIVDEGWDQGGRAEPFVLDLDRLAKIKAEVCEQWPDAEILLLTFNH